MAVHEAAIAEWRSRWERRFVDTCTVTRTTARGTFNETTRLYDPTTITVYSGKALVRPVNQADRVEFGLETVTMQDYLCVFPWDTALMLPGDRAVFSAAEYEPQLVGAVLLVVGAAADSWNTHRNVAARFDQGSGYADTG